MEEGPDEKGRAALAERLEQLRGRVPSTEAELRPFSAGSEYLPDRTLLVAMPVDVADRAAKSVAFANAEGSPSPPAAVVRTSRQRALGRDCHGSAG
ncbi:MAG: hypothetical protein R2864_08210 [Syntrophotaleaceae bacterium]